MPKVSKEKLQARERGIVLAAARCLQRNGLEGTGMRDLFRAANLSPGAVYRYFSGKEEVVAAVAAAGPSLVEALLAVTEGVEDRRRRLRLLLERAAAGEAPARLQCELETAALRSAAIAAALDRRRQSAREALAGALGAAAGAAPHGLIELVMALCEGLARRRLLEPEADLSAAVEAAARLLIGSLDDGALEEGAQPPA